MAPAQVGEAAEVGIGSDQGAAVLDGDGGVLGVGHELPRSVRGAAELGDELPEEIQAESLRRWYPRRPCGPNCAGWHYSVRRSGTLRMVAEVRTPTAAQRTRAAAVARRLVRRPARQVG